MNPKEWTRVNLIAEIRQTRRDYGRPQLKGLDRIRKYVLYKHFLREISFDPCEYALDMNVCMNCTQKDISKLAKESLPEIVEKKAG